MPGGRPISAGDVIAALARFGGGRGDADALRAALQGRAVRSYDELRRRAPPERIGLTSGAHAALFAPLFGEFE